MDKGMFVLVESDVDEEELGFIAKKLKKMQRRRESKKNGLTQSTSLSSSPTLSSPQDSDAASTGSATSTTVSPHMQDKRKRKRKRAVEEGVTTSKKRLRELSRHACENSDDHSSDLPNSHEASVRVSVSASVKNGYFYPKAWRQVNSSHYAFSSDDDSELDDREREQISLTRHIVIPESSFLERKDPNEDIALPGSSSVQASGSLCYMNTHTSTQTKCRTSTSTTSSFSGHVPINGGRVSQLWCGTGSHPKSQAGHSRSAAKRRAEGSSVSCLTNCKSCAAYSLPILSDTDACEMTNYVALDCEFVGVGPKNKSALGRCSIVDHKGTVLFDRFVKPAEPVTDYRTRWSGLRPRHLHHGIPFVAAQEQIAAVIKGKVVVGHAVHNDFRVIAVPHPVHSIRDTSTCKLLCEMADLPSNACALRKLTQILLGRTIQKQEHCSVTDARACMDLFRLVRTRWEPTLKAKLERRAARYTPGDKMKTTESQPELNSYLDDQYWPADLFADSY